jgi:hypothetical protein
MADDKCLVPDRRIIAGIFPDVTDITEDAYNIISNTWETCTFRLRLPSEPRPGLPKDLLIRVVSSGTSLAAVAAFQQLGRLQLGHLVPPTLQVGTATNSKGEALEYSVVPYLNGVTSLDVVWNDLTQDNQKTLMNSVVHEIEKLQTFDPQCDDVQRNLSQLGNTASQDTGTSTETPVGGPEFGYCSGLKELLVGLVNKARRSPSCEILDTSNGITVRSAFDDIGQLELTQSDLDELRKHLVLCHNDLEPRNILVRRTGQGDNGNDQPMK